MQFLLNDTVFEIHDEDMSMPLDGARFNALSLDYVAQLGREMFADDPVVHKNEYERARRLCYLIHLKERNINAAQFFVTRNSKRPEDVTCVFKTLDDEVMESMFEDQARGILSTTRVDQAVWNRLAA